MSHSGKKLFKKIIVFGYNFCQITEHDEKHLMKYIHHSVYAQRKYKVMVKNVALIIQFCIFNMTIKPCYNR